MSLQELFFPPRLAAEKGSSIDVEARGPAAEEAMRAIGALIGDKFREPEWVLFGRAVIRLLLFGSSDT